VKREEGLGIRTELNNFCKENEAWGKDFQQREALNITSRLTPSSTMTARWNWLLVAFAFLALAASHINSTALETHDASDHEALSLESFSLNGTSSRQRELQSQPATLASQNITVDFLMNYPTLTFHLCIGLAKRQNMAASTERAEDTENTRPTSSEMQALLCQLHRFLQQRLQGNIGDGNITTYFHNICWNVTSLAPAHNLPNVTHNALEISLKFTTLSFFGDASFLSPWTLAKHAEITRQEMRQLIRNYLWPLQGTNFVRSRTLYWGGRLATTSRRGAACVFPSDFLWDHLNLMECPPAPRIVHSNIFVHETAVPAPDPVTGSW